MLSAMSYRSRFAIITIGKKRGLGAKLVRSTRHLVVVAQRAGCVQGGTTKGTGHVYSETPAIYRLWRVPFLSGAAAAGHRRFPAQHRAAVRWPREVDPRA